MEDSAPSACTANGVVSPCTQIQSSVTRLMMASETPAAEIQATRVPRTALRSASTMRPKPSARP